MEIPSIPSKRFVFEFSGGFKDGCVIDSASDDPNVAQMARMQYIMSHGGKVGTRFRAVSEAGLQELLSLEITETPEGPMMSHIPVHDMNHVYELGVRIDSDDLITLRYKFLGLANPDGSMNF